MALRLYIKQQVETQVSTGLEGYYDGTNPSNLTFVQGTLPVGRQWPNYGQWIDVTHLVGDLYQLQITWTSNRDEFGDLAEGEVNEKQSISGSIPFEGQAYDLLKKWLINDVSAIQNSVDVRVTHEQCGSYEDLVITAKSLEWCDTNICIFDITLEQRDESITCIKRTLISDNWQGWFPAKSTDSNSGKQHPRFSYCNEIRPNGLLVTLWSIMAIVFFIFFFLLILFIPPLLIILVIILGIFTGINAILQILQVVFPSIQLIDTTTLQNTISSLYGLITGGFQNYVANFYIESAGCGREHPAPLIRDYITNVCDKCGISIDAETAEILFAPDITMYVSEESRGEISVPNPHYNDCYFYAPSKRGVRRFRNFSILGFGNADITTFWLPENDPLLTLDMFLDKIKRHYNADWIIKSRNIGGALVPYLYFKRKDWFRAGAGNYLYDFSQNGADYNKIVQGICYSWNGQTYPAFTEGVYALDAADTCGNEARGQMNGMVSFGNVDENPNFEGKLDKINPIGATKFRLDGASTDYIADSLQTMLNLQITQPYIALFWSDIIENIQQYADYALLLKDESATMPKIITWDNAGYLNAKAARYLYGTPNNGATPTPNLKYNETGEAWSVRHKVETDVIGKTIAGVQGFFPNDGVYAVSGFFGAFSYEAPAMLPNYANYFEPFYQNTLWDWFHFIDDPTQFPLLNQSFSLQIALCCEDLIRLGVFNDSSLIALWDRVKLDKGPFQDGRITEIGVNYNPSAEYGAYIELKGIR